MKPRLTPSLSHGGANQVVERDPVDHHPLGINHQVVYLGRTPQGVPNEPIRVDSLQILYDNLPQGIPMVNPYYANQHLDYEIIQPLLNNPTTYYPPGHPRRLYQVPPESVAVGPDLNQAGGYRLAYKNAKYQYQRHPTRDNYQRYKKYKRRYHRY